MWCTATTILNEILSYLLGNFPSDLRFLVVILIATIREFDNLVRSKLIDKMTGYQNDSATALVTIIIYGYFLWNIYRNSVDRSKLSFRMLHFENLLSHAFYQVIKA